MRVDVSREQIKQAFATVKDDPSFNESRALDAAGKLPAEMIQALCLRPDILRAFAGFGSSVYPGGLLERSVKELVIIEASRRNGCQFCMQSHLSLVKMIGLIEAPLRVLDDLATRSARERLAVEYTKAAMTDSNRIPDSMFSGLTLHFSPPEIVELTFLIGYINMLNLFNNSLQVRYNGDYEAIEGPGGG